MMTPTSIASSNWWQGSNALLRFIADLISAEAGRLRPSNKPLPIVVPLPDTRLDEAGLGFDSLERLQLAAALSEALRLHESGVENCLPARSTLGEWCETVAASLRQSSAFITFRTSGSTGAPKPCSHRLAALAQEVDALSELVSGGSRIIAAVPCHHIYGFLFTILLPRRLGNVPVLDVRGQSPGALAKLARRDDIVVGHPAFWAAAARAASSGWPPGVAGITSTAPCPAETAAALRAAGLSRLLQIHGSSETAGLGWRDKPHGLYTLLPHWKCDVGRRLQRAPLSDGTIAAASVAVPDRLEWLDQRRYRIGGREDGAVQVGGINVFPSCVGEVLRNHPGVAAVAVRLMRPSEGLRLKALVVPRDPGGDDEILRRALEALASNELSSAERPRAYNFGPALPTDAMDKAADHRPEDCRCLGIRAGAMILTSLVQCVEARSFQRQAADPWRDDRHGAGRQISPEKATSLQAKRMHCPARGMEAGMATAGGHALASCGGHMWRGLHR